MGKTIKIIVEPGGISRYYAEPDADQICSTIGPQLSVRRNARVDTWWDLSSDTRSGLRGNPRFRYHGKTNKLQLRANGHMMDYTCPIAWECLWWADMQLSGGPVLGPYATRVEALQQEKEWLFANHLPCRAGVGD